MVSKVSIKSILFGQIDIQSKTVNIALFLLRFYAGYTIMNAGLDKLPLPDWMVDQVIEMGFPFPTQFAWIASFSEFAFGFLLVFGLLTRISGSILAITMGVAAFAFQKVLPLLDMHIAQHFFWIYVVLISTGSGKYSLDYYLLKRQSKSKALIISLIAFSLLLGFGLYKEFSAQPTITEQKPEILSINVAGSFNEWNPSANELLKQPDDNYLISIQLDKPGIIDFKFTANKTWDVNWGEENQSFVGFPINGSAELNTGSNTKNIQAYIPKPGKYTFCFNSNNFSYSLDSTRIK